MDKPFSVEYHDFSEGIVNYVNGSTLPIEVKRDILSRVLEEINKVAIENYNKAKVQYENKEVNGKTK